MSVPSATSPLRIAGDITQLVGHTPMLRLARVAPEPPARPSSRQARFLNPGGSIKDRAALGMILDAEARGLLHPGSTIIEATAGNTGVGLALIGVNRGYAVKLFVPEGFAEEKCILMRGFGAEVVRTPEAEGMAGAIRQARAAGAAIEGSFIALQFQNQANPRFHHDTTAHEFWDQMDGRVDGFVSGVGTGGTFSGVARFLKEQNPAVVTVAVETEGSILQGGAAGQAQSRGHRRQFRPRDVSPRCVRPRAHGVGCGRVRNGEAPGCRGGPRGRLKLRRGCVCCCRIGA